MQCCADLFHAPEVMSVERIPATSNIVIEIYPPAGGSNSYHLNKFCK